MASKRKQQKKIKWTVPPLRLPLQRDPSNDSASTSSTAEMVVLPGAEEIKPPTGARTAPAQVADYVPSCPHCGHYEQVHHWKFWKEWNKYIWHCSYVKKATFDIGPQFCGYMWIEDNREGRCNTCKMRARIQEHGKTLGYYCPGCHDFFQ
jgi:hypothetical protein